LRRVLAAGHSAGGQLALWLAAQMAVELRGVIPLAAVSDLRQAYALQLSNGVVGQFLGGSPDRVPQRYASTSPVELLPISAPQRVIHGTADDIVPFEMSERFTKASHNSKLIPLQGAGHFELIDPKSREWETVRKNIIEWNFQLAISLPRFQFLKGVFQITQKWGCNFRAPRRIVLLWCDSE
jgi:dipeptidyl aminopeptidase/acylaminoacyl peptidase